MSEDSHHSKQNHESAVETMDEEDNKDSVTKISGEEEATDFSVVERGSSEEQLENSIQRAIERTIKRFSNASVTGNEDGKTEEAPEIADAIDYDNVFTNGYRRKCKFMDDSSEEDVESNKENIRHARYKKSNKTSDEESSLTESPNLLRHRLERKKRIICRADSSDDDVPLKKIKPELTEESLSTEYGFARQSQSPEYEFPKRSPSPQHKLASQLASSESEIPSRAASPEYGISANKNRDKNDNYDDLVASEEPGRCISEAIASNQSPKSQLSDDSIEVVEGFLDKTEETTGVRFDSSDDEPIEYHDASHSPNTQSDTSGSYIVAEDSYHHDSMFSESSDDEDDVDYYPDFDEHRSYFLDKNRQIQKIQFNARDTVAHSSSLFKDNSFEMDPAYLTPKLGTSDRKLGKKAQETFHREQSLTVERLQDLHGSLLARPIENQRATDPQGLKVALMPHQQHALAWLQWREQQKPRGGVLADEMGLGKTLTMIALIIASMAKKNEGEDSENEDEWRSSAREQRHLGGTLVVVPASLLAQWDGEIKTRCKRDVLKVEVYHGAKREILPRRLAKNDVVITTYNIVCRQHKMFGILFKIRWRRVILDEAHVIRNHKSQPCQSVCALHTSKRWAVTGTPLHNKEMDLYSLLKFLQCSPFDDVRVWKRWVDNRNDAGHERLATVMKSLMLRRTKQELQTKGELPPLPDKNVEIIEVPLDPEERLVYDKVMLYSRTLFAQFLTQRAEKARTFEFGGGKDYRLSWNYRSTRFTKAQNKLLSLHADVQAHEILVLLIRLRQVCCHPSLIQAMLDRDDIELQAGTDIELFSNANKIHAEEDGDDEDSDDFGVDERVAEPLLTAENPVFDRNRQSSKMRAVIAKIEEVLDKGDKIIVVSQWVGVLNIVAMELDAIDGASYRLFTGKVAVKNRQDILDDFNSRRSNPNILLLSLTAGGVGLNVVGANHMLLVDIHWNPQLETQAQDRIHRFGQTKEVSIYKYICTDTIEERIQALQNKKLELARQVLSGTGKVISSKLSLDDIKSLFGV